MNTLKTDKSTLICSLSGHILKTRTSYNKELDLIHTFSGMDFIDHRINRPFDWVDIGFIEKDNPSFSYTRIFMSNLDAVAPFRINDSWIGANHGQSNGVMVKATAHNKTHADIASVWYDRFGYKWTLLRVQDEDHLLFLSENIGASKENYYFLHKISGTMKFACEEKNNFAKNKSPIRVDEITPFHQVYSGIRKKELSVYAYTGITKTKLEDGDTLSCDYIEIEEKYDVINPSTIADELIKRRPEGGYTDDQSLAVGEAMVSYHMLYRITPDGTILAIADHEILQNINFGSYGILQSPFVDGCLGGKVYRYIPKLAPFKAEDCKTGKDNMYDFSSRVNISDCNFPAGEYQLSYELWEDKTNAPDRVIDFFADENDEIKTAHTIGYLPILGGTRENRCKNTNSCGFLWCTKKMYPYFVDHKPFEYERNTKGFKIKGVAYRKFSPAIDNNVSLITIPYESNTYIYVDCFDNIEKTVYLGDALVGKSFTLIEKSDNMEYSIENAFLSLSMKKGAYGYLVLRAD